MPTYDYECSSCGRRFELFERVHDGGPKPCPKCGKKKAVRQLGTGAGVIFKGSGFYVTDSRKGGSSPPSTPAETPAPEPAKKKTARHEKKKE